MTIINCNYLLSLLFYLILHVFVLFLGFVSTASKIGIWKGPSTKPSLFETFALQSSSKFDFGQRHYPQYNF